MIAYQIHREEKVGGGKLGVNVDGVAVEGFRIEVAQGRM
jgi:hypothetical protein